MDIAHTRTLIEKSYSLDESKRYTVRELTHEQFEIFKNQGIQILKYFPPQSLSCAYISALWVELARQNGLSAYLVAGTLDLRGRRIFNYENEIEYCSVVEKWNGHCWIICNNLIGDASLFRTAYADSSPRWLQDLVINSFGKGRGLLIGTNANLLEDGLVYSSKYIFTDDQLGGLVKHAYKIISEYFKISPNSVETNELH